MKKIDLIALDLDGTALNPQNQVSPATADAVRRARESGIHVVVSTGRICGEARDFALMLGTDDQMVTSGGATLSSVSQERCTMRMSMPWEAAVRASAVVERIGMITMVYVGETLLITCLLYTSIRNDESRTVEFAVDHAVPVRTLRDPKRC